MNNIHKWLTQNTNEVYLHENMTSAITTNFRCWMFDMLSNRASVTSNTINPMKERTPTAIPRLHALVLKSYGQMSDQLGMLAMQLNTTMEKTYSRKKQTQKISKNISYATAMFNIICKKSELFQRLFRTQIWPDTAVSIRLENTRWFSLHHWQQQLRNHWMPCHALRQKMGMIHADLQWRYSYKQTTHTHLIATAYTQMLTSTTTYKNTPHSNKLLNYDWHTRTHARTHTHSRLTALFLGLPGWAGTRKAKAIWILLKQKTVTGSGNSWAICKSAPRSRQITMPALHRSVFLQTGCPSCHPTNSVKALKACTYTCTWNLEIQARPEKEARPQI